MLEMNHNITVGSFRLGMVEEVTIRKSVESLADTATISLPGTYINEALNLEDKIKEGDPVTIELGYNGNLAIEFQGYCNNIATDDSGVLLECEDALYLMRKDIPNKEYHNITINDLLTAVLREVDQSFTLSCNYDFKYDKFVIYNANAFDVLKKIQEETKANIYFKDNVLHVHPQYQEVFNDTPVVYDFAYNIESSDLKYRTADKRKYLVEVEGIAADGTRITTTVGTPGGDKRSIKIYGVTNLASLKQRGEQEMLTLSYDGFEGSFTGWLVPFCEPAFNVLLRDTQYPHKTGTYYVLTTQTTFSSSGGSRQISIGKKMQNG